MVEENTNTKPIDLEQLDKEDMLEGFWWNYIRCDFHFQKSIRKDQYHTFQVSRTGYLVRSCLEHT